MKNLWYCFGGATAPRSAVGGSSGPLVALLFLLLLAAARPAGAQNAAANLDQIRNGSYASPQVPPDWVNGNAGAQQAHFLEGHSIAYRMVITNLTAGAHTVIIGWDVRDGSKNALDFITHYQNLLPHGQFNHPAETVNPLDGLGLSSPSVVTFPIAAPAQIPALPSSFSFYQLQAAGKELMTMFNGTTIDNLQYVVQGNRSLAHAETQLAITFHTTQPTVVFAWGGHIGSQVDWGPGTSAVNINGSPYHTRLISLDGSGGNQDRSLSADAVAQPPTCAFGGPSSGCAGAPLTFTGPAGMSSYLWTVTGGGASPTSGTGQSITVTASSSYSIQLVTVKSGLTSGDNCQQAVTINPTTTATALVDLTRCPGASATFTTTASGAGPFSYSWTRNGVPISGATDASYTIASVSAADAGTYAVTVSGACGAAPRSATLTVNDNAAATALTDLTLCPGASATFATTASGTGPFAYVWALNGVPIAGATDASYTIASVSKADAGTYTVTVSGACGSAERSALLLVNDITTTTALSGLTRCPGASATFTTTASGTGPFAYAWTRNGMPISGATDASFTIASVSAADAGTYAVTVSGACGTAPRSATLTVNERAAATALVDLTRCPGASATFTTTASGTGPFKYSWTRNGVPISGATDASYTIASMSTADAGTYAVTVSGACGSAERSALLNISEATAATALTSLTQCDGTSATFSTTASGTGPFSYSWAKNGVPISGADGPSYTIAALGLADAGTYAVTVTGLCNAATQSAALVVNSCSVQHCTLTQGGYGNGNGVICKYPGVRRTQLIADMLITNDVVLGTAGRSLTYSHTPGTSSAANLARLATAQCIIDKMPAGGTAAAFPTTLGNVNGCSALPNSLLRNGKFNNVLIGQTLALALNARLDNTLSGVVLTASMQSYATLNCTSLDPADLSGIVRTMPAAVLGNLSYLGNSPTVGSLLALANKALGGVAYANAGGNPTASEISGAAGAINELFDNCRVARTSSPVAARPALGGEAASVAVSSLDEALHAYPNPFPATTTLEFALPQTTSYQLAVFDLKGREVVRVSSGEAQAGVRYSFPIGGGLLQEGIYVVRLVTAQRTQTIRLNLIH
ncbi:T9SS type A sorting domain-containing protein [Hymenobacter sp. DH14]|uniref:T9SS type A sorting domain-containing protein n=1 Tax=Hymenobacter cyanobacteriorum TaxID=2926463 RepID=A0A9X1VG93_9BACT|nr:T9SS type A sorting domain-containing protein [Hymenobacter cyanobacteriorum]MCI1188639.1 T9SS type A sorting domain-containing protein [Hymenobacter cyanobacteriorum]